MRIIFSIFLFLVSAGYFFYGFNYSFWSESRPGAGFFPLLLGGILTLLTAINVIMEVRKSKIDNKTAEYNEEHTIKDMLIISLMILIYMIIFPFAGYLISTGLFILGTLGYLNKGKWVQNFMILMILLLVIYFVFDYFLNTGLPGGLLDI